MIVSVFHQAQSGAVANGSLTGAFVDSDTILKNISALLEELSEYKTEDQINQPEAEKKIAERFGAFLLRCGFMAAFLDYEKLLEEKSDSARLRRDGTISWYHEFVPILMNISIIHNQGPSALSSLDRNGGLETMIRTQLRHDSVEDTGIDFNDFNQSANETVVLVMKHLASLYPDVFTDTSAFQTRLEYERKNAALLKANIKMMTRAVVEKDPETGELLRHESGKIKKRKLFLSMEVDRVEDYIFNMIDDNNPDANPVVWMCKQGDGTHNLCTPEFFRNPKDRIKYANEREDMYGAREGFTERAKAKWPEFDFSIRLLDNVMGVVLYVNFGYLKYVDLAYPEKYIEGQDIHPSGIGRYLKRALMVNVPEAFNPMHILLNRVLAISNDQSNPERAIRARNFIEHCLCPALEPYKSSFSYLFSANDNHQPTLKTTPCP